MLVGGGLGVFAWEGFGRRLLGFKYGSLGSSVTCAPDVDRALAEFDAGLRTSALVGSLGFLLAATATAVWLRRRRAQRTTAGASSPA
jgi:hypothetical protein